MSRDDPFSIPEVQIWLCKFSWLNMQTPAWHTLTCTHWTSESNDEVTPSWWIWGRPDRMATASLLWFSWTSWSASWGLTDRRSVHQLQPNIKWTLSNNMTVPRSWPSCMALNRHFGNNTATCVSCVCVDRVEGNLVCVLWWCSLKLRIQECFVTLDVQVSV